MTCQIKVLSLLADIDAVKKSLFPGAEDDNASDFGWEDSWDWNENGDANAVTNKKNFDQSWVQDCFVSFSPTGDALILATTRNLVFLTLKWDMHEEGEVKAKFVVYWECELVEDRREEITGVLCLPLASQKRSLQGGPDWTCIVVGFSTGHVKMYTENGVQLFSQVFHEGPITKLKYRTYEPPRHAKCPEQQEELIVLYPWAVVTIDGFSLFQTLRACRNQVARATASGQDIVTPPPLEYKKWGFEDQETVVDCQHIGIMPTTMFDHLQTASVLGGFNAHARNNVPIASLFLTSGQSPYATFYYAIDGSTQTLMSEVASAVATKLKSVLFSAASGIFGMGSSKTAEEQRQTKTKIEPATPLACRFGLSDSRRFGDSLKVSPNKMLAAVTDNFGRVVLIDTHQGVAVRMWKGYRDAQCGWIEVVEDTHRQDKQKVTPVPRIALFLVIYAPRRGLLEVWRAQQGPRIAAFNVSKWARLVYPGYGMMGVNVGNPIQHRQQTPQCFLMDPDGSVKTISVPFHYALGDKNSKRAQSLHLLKKLKIMLKENELADEKVRASITKTVADIKTPSIRQQAVESLANNANVTAELMDSVVSALLEHRTPQDFEILDYESKILLQCCQRLKQLVKLYTDMTTTNADFKDSSVCTPSDNEVERLAAVLHLTDSEVESFLGNLKSFEVSSSAKCAKSVSFVDDGKISLASFLSCFDVFSSHLVPVALTAAATEAGGGKEEDEGDSAKNSAGKSAGNVAEFSFDLPLLLSPDIDADTKSRLGCFMFHSCVCCTSVMIEGSPFESEILPETLLALTVHFWLHHSVVINTPQCLINLSSVVKYLSGKKAPSTVTSSYNEVSSWWQDVRNVLSHATNSALAYSAAVVCRGVALTMASCLPEKKVIPADKDLDCRGSQESLTLTDWESISMDALQWNVLVKQLEDLLVLSKLLTHRPRDISSFSSSGDVVTSLSFSLSSLVDEGPGIVSELVGRWLISTGLDGHLVKVVPPDDNESSPDTTTGGDPKELAVELKFDEDAEEANELLVRAQMRFPFSLEMDVLIANCAWEHAVLWNKDPDAMVQLEGALNCVQLLNNAILKHGLTSMIWHTFVSGKFTATALLMEKVGKVPKDRLCRRDIGISEPTLEKFLGMCIQLLDTLMEASVATITSSTPTFGCEDFWQHRQGNNSSTLAELAIGQKLTYYNLVCHHYQLALSMHMMVTFYLKLIKPISFYDTKGKSAFFKELHSHPQIPLQDLDIAITSARTQFLCRVISAAVQSLPDAVPESATAAPAAAENDNGGCSSDDGEASATSAVVSSSTMLTPTVDSSSASHWFGQCLNLAKLWGVDCDVLRRHYVCELYNSGLDSLAEEVLPAVNDKEVMGSQLILLSGQRLYNTVKNKYKSVEVLTRLSPDLSTWLRTLNQGALRCLNPPLTMTATLIRHVINQLPDGHSEYQMALALVDAVDSLIDLPQLEGSPQRDNNTG